MKRILFVLAFISLAFSAGAEDKVVSKLLEMGRNDNRTMQHADFLANRIGGRPVGSHNLQDAEAWVADQFKSWGLEVMVQEVGEINVGFSRGPWFGRMVGGDGMQLHFVTASYTAGTKGPQKGRVLIEPQSQDEFNRMKSALKGAWVLMSGSYGSSIDWSTKGDSLRNVKIAKRDSIIALNKEIRDWNKKNPTERKKLHDVPAVPGMFCHEMKEAGVLGFIQSDEVPLTGQYARDCFSLTMETLPTVCEIKLDCNQFDVIKRMAEERRDFQLEFDIRNHFFKGPVKFHNVIGILKGKKHPDEYVLMGAHLDAFDVASGAVDDANGISVIMEAARLLTACGAKPDRTIMFCAWTGEENGLLGSKYFVTNKTVPLEKIANYMNRDSGPLAAVSTTVPQAMYDDICRICKPLETYDPQMPFKVNLKTEKPGPRPTKGGGSDHAYFQRNGIPTVNFPATDIKGYDFKYTDIWHTECDNFDRLYPDYLEHAAVVEAVVSYGIANLPHLLSREGLYTD